MALTTKEFANRPPVSGWLIAGAVLAVLLLVALIAKGCSTGDTAPTTGPGSTSVPTSATTAKGSVLPQNPQLQQAKSDPEWLTAAPHRISWQRVDGIPFPFSDSDGPTHITGAVATGYSHTPQGAVLAATHITFRLAWSPDYQAVLDAQTRVSDRTRASLIDGRSHSGNVDPDMVAAVAKAPVAFKVADYTDTSATVYLAFPTPSTTYRFAPVAVVWDDGDWRYTDADNLPDLPPSESLDGFTSLEEDK